jgi:hypothetical protein
MSEEDLSEGQSKTAASCAKGCISSVVAGFVLLVVGVGLMTWVGTMPYKYFLEDSSNRHERETLVNTLSDEIDGYYREIEQLSDKDCAWAYDADGLFPLDRALITRAIQEYHLSTGHLPSSMEDLHAKEFLKQSVLRYDFYRFEVNGGEWRVFAGTRDRPIAMGN